MADPGHGAGMQRLRSSTMSSRGSIESSDHPQLQLQVGARKGDGDPLSDLAVPMPEEIIKSPLSHVSSRRNLRRGESMRSTRSDVNSEVDPGIGEALDALSRTLSRKGSFFSNVSKQSFSHLTAAAQGATRLGMNAGGKPAPPRVMDKSLVSGLDVSIPIVVDDSGPSPMAGLGDRSQSLLSESISSVRDVVDEGDEEEELPDDIDELKNIVKWRMEQLQEAVDMGQKVFADLRDCKEELNLALEDNGLIEEELELSKKEAQEYAARVRTLSRQVADARSTIAELDQKIMEQEQEMREMEEVLQNQRAKFEESREEMREEQRWQEEKFVAVQEAAKRKEKGNIHVMEMKEALANNMTRTRYFRKLRLYCLENKKKRQCFHYLHFNLRQEVRNREDLKDIFFSRWCTWARLGLERKRRQREAFEAQEAASRSVLEQHAQSQLIYDMNATIALSVFAWQVAVEEAGYIQEDLEGEIKLVRDTTECVIAETTWRQKVWTQCMTGMSATLQAAMNCATNEWLATHSAAALKAGELTRIREQWGSETKELRDQLSKRDSSAQALHTQLKEIETRYAASQSTVELQELAIGELRQEKARTNADMISLQEQYERAEAELARAKSQLEFQHTRAKTRVEAMSGNAAITPCLKQAMALVSSLRARTEATQRLSDPAREYSTSPTTSAASPPHTNGDSPPPVAATG